MNLAGATAIVTGASNGIGRSRPRLRWLEQAPASRSVRGGSTGSEPLQASFPARITWSRIST